MPTVAQLMKALPDDAIADRDATPGLPPEVAAESLRPVPVGRLRRIGLLGTL